MRGISVFTSLSLVLAVLATTPVAAGHHKSGEKSNPRERFLKADANGDGMISRAEFIAGAEMRFDKMDADGDGQLSKEELRRAAKRRRND